MKELSAFCGGNREIVVSRELTKRYEEHIGNDINNVIKFFEEKEVKGEITIVIKGINKRTNKEFDLSELKRELIDLVDAGLSLSSASKYLSKKIGIKKSLIYNLY